MTSRREFLRMGVAATALPVAASAEALVTAQATDAVPLYKVLYDTRFAASVAFARRAAARGAAVQAMTGDVTGFWYGDLYHRWRQAPAAIAGLTAHGALFCLERLAWDQRMRVVFRGEHACAPDGGVVHRFEGPAELLTSAVQVMRHSAWPSGVADVVVRCPAARTPRDTAQASTVQAALPPAPEVLFSWVIASVPRA